MTNGAEPSRGYTVAEGAQIAAAIAAAAARGGRPTKALERRIERIKAKAVERERIEDEARTKREDAKRAAKVERRANRSFW